MNVTKYPFNTNQRNNDLVLLKSENKSFSWLFPIILKSLSPVNPAAYLALFSPPVIAKISELFCSGSPGIQNRVSFCFMVQYEFLFISL